MNLNSFTIDLNSANTSPSIFSKASDGFDTLSASIGRMGINNEMEIDRISSSDPLDSINVIFPKSLETL